MLYRPVLAKANNRNNLAQTNPYCGNPDDWFDSIYFKQRHIFSTSFDFFVNWEEETIANEVWIKRISDSEEIFNEDSRRLRAEISLCDGKEKSNRDYYFFIHNNLVEKYMIFRDVPENKWQNNVERIVELDMTRYKNPPNYLNVEDIQNRIKNLRVRPANIGNAGLIYSTSTLEAYLSKQPFFWPGDADIVLYDENSTTLAIIELKKHTARSRISFQQQGLSNYLRRDILKYKSLFLLKEYLKTDLYVLYYPIPKDIRSIIIEKIEGNIDEMSVSERHTLDLPQINNQLSLSNFTNEFLTRVLHR